MKISTEHNGENHQRIILTHADGTQFKVSENEKGFTITKVYQENANRLEIEPVVSNTIRIR